MASVFLQELTKTSRKIVTASDAIHVKVGFVTHKENSILFHNFQHPLIEIKSPYKIIKLQLLNHHDFIWVVIIIVGTMVERVPLYISDNLPALKLLIKDDIVKGLKRLDRLPGVAHRMFIELLHTQNDQERSYIIARRYLKVMDHLLKLTADRKFLEICYGSEYRKVQSLIADLEADLEARYEDLARRKLNNERIHQPGQPQLYDTELFFRKFPITNNLFISSKDLYNAIRNKWNILIVDIRRSNDFKESRITIENQHLINIPEDILLPGLSANTLSQRLDEPTRQVWNKRDAFEVIILLDWNTDHFNFQGSKLDRLRICIVEWDLNRKYKHDPVILDGGFKEFLESYPSEITNGHMFLSRTNSEVDELLLIDDISYPELVLTTDAEVIFDTRTRDRRSLEREEFPKENGVPANRVNIGNQVMCDERVEENEETYGNIFAEGARDDIDVYEDARKANVASVIDRTTKPFLEELGAGYTGITNLGNNCYMSCMLQCLKSLPHFKAMFVTSNNYYKHINKEKPDIIVHFASVMRALWRGTADYPETFYPRTFFERVYKINPLYRKGNHEDTFEFFIFLFNLLSDDCSYDLPRLKAMTEREKSLYVQLQGRTSRFVDLFYYQLRNDKVCWRCRKPSLVFDSDSTLMLPLSERGERQSLEYLLGEYLRESLVPDCSCSECKYSSTIVNRKRIVLDPEILVIVLKRYAVGPDASFRKIESDVSFPVSDLRFGGSRYRLYAVPQHVGSVSVGHYYASVLIDDSEGTWAKFNDDQVAEYRCPIDEVSNIGSSCVGFFYVRQNEC